MGVNEIPMDESSLPWLEQQIRQAERDAGVEPPPLPTITTYWQGAYMSTTPTVYSTTPPPGMTSAEMWAAQFAKIPDPTKRKILDSYGGRSTADFDDDEEYW